MVCEILPKIERINLQNCIKVDDKQKSRDLNEEERKVLQSALNCFSNKVSAACMNKRISVRLFYFIFITKDENLTQDNFYEHR